MPTVRLNDIDVYFERSGDGPRLLYLNGSGTTLATAAMVLAPFREVFELAAHDQRGLGSTSIPDRPATMSDYAADAVALLDHLEWETARVVGISFGGMVAQELAVTIPERVERLALLCTSPGGAGGSSYPLHELEDLPADEAAAIDLRILDTRYSADFLAEHPVDQLIADVMAQRRAGVEPPEVKRGRVVQLEARRHHDVFDRLDRITSPTLVAAGRHDGIAPPSNAEAIASRIPDVELRWYEGGHIFFMQDPQALPDVVEFLAR